MPDWQKFFQERFTERCSRAETEPEVTEELAHHLEDLYEARLAEGLTEYQAVQRALAEVRNWPRLARNIKLAREGGEMLKQRIQTMWIPGLVTAILTVAASVAVGRATSTLLAERPMALFVYGGWLLILTGIGALAAYWSRRAGGSIGYRTTAALFPAATLLAAIGSLLTNPELKISVIASVFSPGEVQILPMLPVIANSVVCGIFLPTAALLAGALPFLRVNGVAGTLSPD